MCPVMAESSPEDVLAVTVACSSHASSAMYTQAFNFKTVPASDRHRGFGNGRRLPSSPHPHPLKMILAIVVSSFVVSSIPIVSQLALEGIQTQSQALSGRQR